MPRRGGRGKRASARPCCTLKLATKVDTQRRLPPPEGITTPPPPPPPTAAAAAAAGPAVPLQAMEVAPTRPVGVLSPPTPVLPRQPPPLPPPPPSPQRTATAWPNPSGGRPRARLATTGVSDLERLARLAWPSVAQGRLRRRRQSVVHEPLRRHLHRRQRSSRSRSRRQGPKLRAPRRAERRRAAVGSESKATPMKSHQSCRLASTQLPMPCR